MTDGEEWSMSVVPASKRYRSHRKPLSAGFISRALSLSEEDTEVDFEFDGKVVRIVESALALRIK
jgi:hypothetical protein